MEIGKMPKRISIPDTDLSLYPIGLGTVGAGVHWDGADADRIFDTYLDLGGNVVDSARIYSDWIPPEIGRSERVLGDWIQRSGKRDRFVLITKGGHPVFRKPTDDLHLSRMTPSDMRHDIELSLKTLRVDTIDIYFYHRDNKLQTVEEEIETMEQFKKEGKIRYYGCSNWDSSRICEADNYCVRKGYRGFVADQALLNLGLKYIDHMPDDTLVAITGDLHRYHEHNLRNLAMPYMGVASGFFHIFAAKGEDGVKSNPYYTPGNVKMALRCTELMKKYNASISQVVLGFFQHQPFPCVPLYGPENAEQLKDAMGAVEIDFEEADFDI
jgi:aryl-alcohol dehydrogenase-like predicted oxidoreductase